MLKYYLNRPTYASRAIFSQAWHKLQFYTNPSPYFVLNCNSFLQLESTGATG